MKGELTSAKLRELIEIDYCKRCGYNEFKCCLQVHHMDKDKTNNDTSNLILLCINCHRSLHYNRWKLEDIGIETPPNRKRTERDDWDPDVVHEIIKMHVGKII